MRDRTKELGNTAEASDEDEEGRALMVKPGISTVKEEKENDAFFKKVLEIRGVMEMLKKVVSDLENKQKTVLGVALPEDGMKRELQTLREEIKTMAMQIQKKLNTIEPKKGDDDGKYVPINLRMQRAQHGVLSREFVELMDHCNTIQASYRDRNVERIQRQLRITGTNVTDEELDGMLESGQTDVFTQNGSIYLRAYDRQLVVGASAEPEERLLILLLDSLRPAIILIDAKATKQALNEIESRHDEILKLERSIKDLHDMFRYLAMEVEAQGEMVNRIEANIINSTNYVEKAVADTAKAATYQNKARKKKIWIALCCAILLLILAISLAISFS
ncbi:unnamed protein product [Oncorhynchus mykiss]|uniref:t-SNARE coiled-coil homology domain-containing protein n=1 Tax=Oncorhynchus mykiss TaxID=8022 RepID=A0A060Y1L9_ONCMY|nr:unnamed protein product [Oncorhynchus mykiss]